MKKTVIMLLFALLLVSAAARETGGVELPDTLNLSGQELLLNGAGLRKKAIIKVYACGLYLAAPAQDAAAILADSSAIVIRMHFIYPKVDNEKLIAAWNEGFAAAGVSQSMAAEIAQFNSFFTQPAVKGDIYDISYLPDTGIQVTMNGQLVGRVTNPAFRSAVFAIWLGQNTALPKLKTQLLNK
jgi:hypothetical protein